MNTLEETKLEENTEQFDHTGSWAEQIGFLVKDLLQIQHEDRTFYYTNMDDGTFQVRSRNERCLIKEEKRGENVILRITGIPLRGYIHHELGKKYEVVEESNSLILK